MLLFVPWDTEVERGAFANCALQPDTAAVRLNDSLCDGQSQADTTQISLAHLEEAVKDPPLILS
jgi:hypothetical protein